jgi:hypothetical protein
VIHIHLQPKKQASTAPSLAKPASKPTLSVRMASEWDRRQKIIDAELKGIDYTEGDRVEYSRPENAKQWGDGVLSVAKIARSVAAATSKGEDWPVSDKPMLVLITTDQGKCFFCTTNYVKKAAA